MTGTGTDRGRGAASVLRSLDAETTAARVGLRADAYSAARAIAARHKLALYDVLVAIVESRVDPELDLIRTGLRRGWWNEAGSLVDHSETVRWWQHAVSGGGTTPPPDATYSDWADVLALAHIDRAYSEPERVRLTRVAQIVERIAPDLLF